jgi:hypothetical protein
MLLTIDMYSGRENPTWRLPLPQAQALFDCIADNGLLRCVASGSWPTNLGYRGIQLQLPLEIYSKFALPPFLNLSADVLDHEDLFSDLVSVTRDSTFFAFSGLQYVMAKVADFLSASSGSSSSSGSSGASASPLPTNISSPCKFEQLKFEPGPWNDPTFIKTNNCYAYATNKLAAYPSKPQPGKASGKQYTDPPTGPDVAAAAKRDGAHDSLDCFPDSEAPRMFVALVIWPGAQGDYHWYRKHPDSWGHKPGSTPARNVDDSGKVIKDPATCDRGPYTDFIGYMLIPKSQKVAA